MSSPGLYITQALRLLRFGNMSYIKLLLTLPVVVNCTGAVCIMHL